MSASIESRGAPLSLVVNPDLIPALDHWAGLVGGNRSGVVRRFFEIGLAKAASENPEIEAVFGCLLKAVRPNARKAASPNATTSKKLPPHDRLAGTGAAPQERKCDVRVCNVGRVRERQ